MKYRENAKKAEEKYLKFIFQETEFFNVWKVKGRARRQTVCNGRNEYGVFFIFDRTWL